MSVSRAPATEEPSIGIPAILDLLFGKVESLELMVRDMRIKQEQCAEMAKTELRKLRGQFPKADLWHPRHNPNGGIPG